MVDDSEGAQQERPGAPRTAFAAGARSVGGAEACEKEQEVAMGFPESEEKGREHWARPEGDRAGRGELQGRLPRPRLAPHRRESDGGWRCPSLGCLEDSEPRRDWY